MPESPVLAFTEPYDLPHWRGEVARAEHVRKSWERWWDANLKAYAPGPTDDPDQYGTRINTNRDFTLVERKKADLFFQQPDVSCTPSPLFQGQENLLDTHANILNELLGLDGVDAKRLAHEAMFDVLGVSGIGPTKIGYEVVLTPVPEAPSGVPIFERVFWSHFTPKQLLIPESWRSTRYDDAPWLGLRFEMPTALAKQTWQLPEDFQAGQTSAEQHFDYGVGQQAKDIVTGTEIWYKSSLYRQDVRHPQHLTILVLIDGLEQPVEHRDSPYQSFDERGRLTADSMIGFPIHPLVMRTMTDSAYVPADCTISRPLVNELNMFREQMVMMRDANILRWMYNTDTLPPDAVKKMVRAPLGGMIGLPPEAFVGEGAIKELPHANFPRENFTFNDYLDNDLARTHAMDANQAGASNPTDKTATEVATTQANVNARLDLERGLVLDWYVRGVTKFSALVQRFLSIEDAARIVGPEKAQEWDAWRKQVPASLAFQAQPDSALRTDLAYERKQVMDLYSYFANEPQVNRLELVKSILRKFHLPVDKIVVEQPPQKSPESAKPQFSFKGDDLNPLMPQFPIVMEVMRQSGFQVSPQAVQEAQVGALNQAMAQQVAAADTGEGEPGAAEHGGKQPQAETLSKHQADLTGGMPGTGSPAPMGAVQ